MPRGLNHRAERHAVTSVRSARWSVVDGAERIGRVLDVVRVELIVCRADDALGLTELSRVARV